MTVDLDLLADYVEGLLDPADQERVESLVRDDRVWASALDALQAALPSVGSTLASVPAEPMPAAVLTASLQALASERAGHLRTPSGPRTERDTTRPTSGRPPKSRSRRRISRQVVAACALLVVFVVGMGFLVDLTRGDHDMATPSAAKAAAPQSASGSAAGDVTIIASGSNYTAVTLPSAFGVREPAIGGPSFGIGRTPTSTIPGAMHQLVPSGLDRLQPQAALAACLQQVNSEIGGRRRGRRLRVVPGHARLDHHAARCRHGRRGWCQLRCARFRNRRVGAILRRWRPV